MTKNNTDISFSIADFLNSRIGKHIRLFDDASLDENGNLISFSDQAAIVTHYINANSSDKQVFEVKGRKIINSWLSWVVEQSLSEYSLADTTLDAFSRYLFKDFTNAPFKHVQKPAFRFIDLFAGLGGFRLAMQSCGGECVYSSEWDENAKKTYYQNFGDVPFGDITKESNKSLVPDNFDILCAGFPCQAFSIAGYRRGFEDTRGTLFFDVAEIVKRKRPKAIFLENVKNLYTHDNGRTFSVIKETLEGLGYVVYHKVMNALEYANVPQNRERIFIVCFDPVQVEKHSIFQFPDKEELTNTIKDLIDDSVDDSKFFYTEKFPHYDLLLKDVTSKDTIYQWRRQYVRENKRNVCPTLTANMGTGGHNVPLIATDKGIRKLTPKECLNFQGFPKDYSFPNSIADSAKYKQAGNSVVVPLIEKVCRQITSVILANS